MRRWVVWLHTYGLLLCAAYLLVLGVSTLLMNHRGQDEASGPGASWERTIASPPSGTNQQRAESVRDQLGLMGWVVSWEMRSDADGTLRFPLSRPGKNYRIQLLPDGQTVRVQETYAGVAPILHAMHGMMNIPGSRLAAAWGWYTRLCTVALFVAAVSGLYMFVGRGSGRRVGVALAIAGSVTALIAVVFLVFVA